MIVFWSCAAGLLVLAMLFLLPALLRGPARTYGAALGTNLPILKEQLAQLDVDLALGALTAEQHGAARREIERRIIEEENDDSAPNITGPAFKTSLVLAFAVPIVALGLYGWLGKPEALLPQAARPAGEGVTQQQIEEMVEKLAKRMETQPDDATGWTMLARSYAVLGRFDEASKAYAKAVKLTPKDAQLLVDFADALAMTQGQSAIGEPTRLIDQALQIDPANLKGLALAGSAAFERQDFAKAINFWTRAKQLAPADSEFAKAIEQSLGDARDALSKAGGTPPALATAPATAPAQPATVASSTARVGGTVSLAPALAAKVQPDDTVFIFARAAQGPRMPLAILKRSAKELPITFTLDDAMAMAPELKLSKFDMVVVGARISKSGNALPQSGDLQGQSAPSKVGSGDLKIVIDSVVP
jgi:cytochrome c-type biogenesis protein CcmH